jgi:DNA primase
MWTDFIDEIRERLHIIEIVSERIRVTGEAAALKASCPFHQPPEESLYLNHQQKFFHCLLCNIGGDAIKFVELYDKISYFEAATKLAARVGVVMPD